MKIISSIFIAIALLCLASTTNAAPYHKDMMEKISIINSGWQQTLTNPYHQMNIPHKDVVAVEICSRNSQDPDKTEATIVFVKIAGEYRIEAILFKPFNVVAGKIAELLQ